MDLVSTNTTDVSPSVGRQTRSTNGLIACAGCDLLHHDVDLAPGASAHCRRCGNLLYTRKLSSIDRGLALTLASSVFFLLANIFPFISIEIQGITQEISMLSAALELFYQGMPWLGVFAAAVIFVFPLLQLVGMLMVLIPLSQGRATLLGRRSLRLVAVVAPWSMMEIYLLGVLVSLVKLATYAEVSFGVAFWNFVALVITNTWAATSIDRFELWKRLEASS